MRRTAVALALVLLATPAASARGIRGFEVLGEARLPPPPEPSPSGINSSVTSIQVQGGFAYIAGSDGGIVRIWDVRSPSAPAPLCDIVLTTQPGANEDVEDVLVLGRYVYAGVVDTSTPTAGIRIYDILDPAAPVCPEPGADPIRTLLPLEQASSIFLYTIGTTPYLFATDPYPPATGLHVFALTPPDDPIHVTTWDTTSPSPECRLYPNRCTPSAVFVGRALGRDWLLVAANGDGVYVLDVSEIQPAPSDPPATVAHFTYDWATDEPCDADGDGDILDGADVPAGRRQPARTQAVALLDLDGVPYIATGDAARCGAHIVLWSLEEVLRDCRDGSPCDPAGTPPPGPVSEHRVRSSPPWGIAGLVQVPLQPFVFAAVTEEGLEAIDLTDPARPVAIGWYDPLEPDTDGCAENGIEDCGFTSQGKDPGVVNRGLWGAFGIFVDPASCLVYLTSRGSPDNNGAPPATAGTAGSLTVLRYTGGPDGHHALRIAKEIDGAGRPTGALVASWGVPPFGGTYNVYRGTLPARGDPWTWNHDRFPNAPDPCDLAIPSLRIGGEYSVGIPSADRGTYYLVTTRDVCGHLEGATGWTLDPPGLDPYAVSPRPPPMNPCPSSHAR